MVSFDGFKSTSARNSEVKGRVRKTNTNAELLLRRALWQRGLRYRIHAKKLPGTPDIVFYKYRLAIFCDGDFWHGRNWVTRRERLAKGSNPGYWIPKIESNMARDRLVNHQLREMGWTVLRFWEGDIKTQVNAIADVVISHLQEK
jgi:DNA mismatch endonuclease, patch repair protein